MPLPFQEGLWQLVGIPTQRKRKWALEKSNELSSPPEQWRSCLRTQTHMLLASLSAFTLSSKSVQTEMSFPGLGWPSRQEFSCLWLPSKTSNMLSDVSRALWQSGRLDSSEENALTYKCVEITSKCNFGESWFDLFWKEGREWISMLSLYMGGCCLPKGGVKSLSHFWYSSWACPWIHQSIISSRLDVILHKRHKEPLMYWRHPLLRWLL